MRHLRDGQHSKVGVSPLDCWNDAAAKNISRHQILNFHDVAVAVLEAALCSSPDIVASMGLVVALLGQAEEARMNKNPRF